MMRQLNNLVQETRPQAGFFCYRLNEKLDDKLKISIEDKQLFIFIIYSKSPISSIF